MLFKDFSNEQVNILSTMVTDKLFKLGFDKNDYEKLDTKEGRILLRECNKDIDVLKDLKYNLEQEQFNRSQGIKL